LDHRWSKSRQDAYSSMCDLRTSVGENFDATNGKLAGIMISMYHTLEMRLKNSARDMLIGWRSVLTYSCKTSWEASRRVTALPPFSHTGVDYAEPFSIIPFVGCGQRARKHYISLFICLATKAIHLEIVEDYTAAGFLAAFDLWVDAI